MKKDDTVVMKESEIFDLIEKAIKVGKTSEIDMRDLIRVSCLWGMLTGSIVTVLIIFTCLKWF